MNWLRWNWNPPSKEKYFHYPCDRSVFGKYAYFIWFQFGEKNFSYTVVEVRFFIELQRKPFYYVMNVVIPTVVLAILSTLTFLIPADSGEKLSMGVSVLLAFTVFMLILSDNTPQTSDNAPLLGKIDLSPIFIKPHPNHECCEFFYNYVLH